MNLTAIKTEITTSIGKIAVYIKRQISDRTPIIFLHGIYFDHQLWNKQIEGITNRTIITVDMPMHGNSREIINPAWTLDDCANMLIEILNSLEIPKVIAIGHSWGSMTILRAASRQPDRFESVGLCNMSFKPATKGQKIASWFQHSMLIFRNFYANQSVKALFGKTSLEENPSLTAQLKRSMGKLTNRQIRHIDKAVMMDPEDSSNLIEALKVNAIALRGADDFVPVPPKIETITVKGGHVSPLEQPAEVSDLINRLSFHN